MSKAIDRFIAVVLFSCVLITVITTVTVVVLLATQSAGFFKEVTFFDFLFGTKWTPLLEPKNFGVLPLVLGTLMIVFGSALLALPLGVLVAIYLSEFAGEAKRSFIKPVLEVLAGIPTVVYGYFALTFITPTLKSLNPDIEVFNALSGAIVVGIMILPMVSSLCDDAFRALPESIRQGAYALGASPSEVILQVLVPASITRIGAATVLAVSRAIGETMAVTLAAGATPKFGVDFFSSVQTMTAYIVQVSLGDTPHGGVEYFSAFAVGALLFAMTLVMNMLGNHLIFKGGRHQL